MTAFVDLIQNPTILCAFFAWFLAQFYKVLMAVFRDRRFDFRVFVRLGGMPSSHSSMVCALATSVGLRTGFGSPAFAVAMGFAVVVMFDAQSVRRAAGHQARVLNQMRDELFKEHHLSQKRLVEFLGHTPLEVLFGMLLGIFTGWAFHTHWHP
ncbi:MAG: divergent PAP2 family protein [Verrucomicrobiota bacterium]